jgi:hypothetical protein
VLMSEKIYALLLKLYPARFRADYGASVMHLFRDRLREESGMLRRFRFWVDMITDLVISIPREHRRRNYAETEVPGYRLSEEAVNALCKKHIIEPAVSFYLFLALGFTTGWFGASERRTLLFAYLLLATIGLGRFLGISKFKKRWRSNEVILGTELIQQKHLHYDVTLHKSQVARIIENPKGLLVVAQEANRTRTVFVPDGITGYFQIRKDLSEWMPITLQPELWLSNPWPVLGCMAAWVPAILLTRSQNWFICAAGIYYSLALLVITVNIARPLNSSRKAEEGWGLNLAPPKHVLRRFENQLRHAPATWRTLLVLILLPFARTLLAFRR